VLTRRELVNSRETVYTGGNEINMLDSKTESSCDRESAKATDPFDKDLYAVLDGGK
jgi:hypothetical protein